MTIPYDSLNTSDVKIFIKEISSNGNLNTVDIIFPTFPFFYIFSPKWIKYLLEPMMEYLATGDYPNPYVIHDMGSHYPNATGHDGVSEEMMPVEETGNLLILVLAYQLGTGDTSWRDTYRDLLDGYADYLILNGLYPDTQLSTNDGLGAFTNMTNLAVKAAIGLSAYAQVTGETKYQRIATQFARTIYTPGVGIRISPKTHKSYFTTTYQDDQWFMLFNLYPQRLFGLRTFRGKAFRGQSAFYQTVRGAAGVPIDGNSSSVLWAKTDWQMWCAAISRPKTRNMFVSDLHAYMSNQKNTQPFSDRYTAVGDDAGLVQENFRDRPTLGGHFALWALQLGANSGT